MGTSLRPRRRIVADIAASIVGTTVLLCLAEVGARWLDLQGGYFMIPTPSNCLQRSESLGMEFRANCAATWRDRFLTGDQQTVFRTNSLGLRDSEVADDNAVRILALGDSCTWGWEMGQDEAYPQVLQRLLDAATVAGQYRVINAGRPGYTSYQGLVYLRDGGFALDPAIVIVAFGFNDAQPTGDVEDDLERQQRFMAVVRGDDFLLSHSRLWRWVRTALRSPPPRNLPLRVPPEKFKRNLAEMIELTRAHAAKPLLVTLSGAPGDKAPYSSAASQIAGQLDVPIVVYMGPRLDIVHPTREGNVQLATEILGRMDAAGYLQRAAPFAARAGR